MQINNPSIEINGKKIKYDVAPIQVNDSRTLVPVRIIAESFGWLVDWDEATKTVSIYERQKYFNTIDDAAYDWAMHWNAMSIAMFKEMCAIIYKDINGYYWDNVRISNADGKEVVFNTVKAKKGVALIHSHGGGEHWNTKTMSKADLDVAKQFKKPLYMVDSGGCLWVYDPSEDKPKQKLIKDDLPKDARWMAIDSSPMSIYFASTGNHELKDYELGYKAYYYNNLYLNGLSYLND